MGLTWGPRRWASPPSTGGSQAVGLTLRPLADTARDTLSWWKARSAEEQSLRTGLSPEKEAAILDDWHARTG